MKILNTIFSVYLFMNLVSPVKMNYHYDDSHNNGYVGHSGERNNYALGLNGKQQRFIGYSNNLVYQMTNNERTNTKISKPPTLEPILTEEKYPSATFQKTTEPPKRQQKKEDVSYQEPRNVRTRGKSMPNQNFRSVSNARNKEYQAQTKQHEQNLKVMKANIYDNKGNIVQVNVNKTPIPAEPQKVKLNSNRQITALSVQRREDNHKRKSTSLIVDKTLKKGVSFKERNAQTMSRVLDDLTKKVTNRRAKNNEYRKRDIDSSLESSPSTKRHIASDTVKKYIGKDINMNMEINQPKETTKVVTGTVGTHEEDGEENNAPYAVFYRMSPESLDNQEVFYMKSMENDGDKVFSPKEKRLTVNYQNEVDLKKMKTKKNFNSVKLRKKVKNFANFRNNK